MNHNFNIWYETYDPNFLDICKKSRVPDKWLRYDKISKHYRESIIQPINPYIEYMCPPPRLISIVDGLVTLEQQTYAEIMINNTGDNLVTIDKVWLRQYYQSKRSIKHGKDCFDNTFVAFVPWIVSGKVDVTIEPVELSPIVVNRRQVPMVKVPEETEYLSPPHIPFLFRSKGPHMKVDGTWGIIRKHTPFFRMTFRCDDIMVERIKEFYEKEK